MKVMKIILLLYTLVFWIPVVGLAGTSWTEEAVKSSTGWLVSKEASFVTLYHEEDLLFSKTGQADIHVRKVIRILKEPNRYLVIPIGETTSFRKIKRLKGWRLSADGRKEKRLQKEDIARISTPVAPGFYDDRHIILARFSGLHSDSIIAVEYRVVEKGWSCFHQRISIQDQQPVFYVNISVTIPKGWRLFRSGWQSDEIATEHTRNHLELTGSKLTYQRKEPLMPPSPMYLTRHITLSCYDPSSESGLAQFADWRSVASWVGQMFQTTPDDVIVERVRKLTDGLAKRGEKLNAIATFVQDEIRYVAVEIGMGGWRPRPASRTLHNRYGDCKDKVTLMRTMLQAVGIPSVAVLANAGRFADVKRDFPSPFSFNHVIVAIPIDQLPDMPPMPDASKEGWLFFDPTDESMPLGGLPALLQGTRVLLAGETDPLLVSLPRCPPERNKRNYRAEIRLRENGSFDADVRITDHGDMATASRHSRRRTSMEKQVEGWKRSLSRAVPGLVLSRYRTGGDGNTTWVSFKLEAESYIRQAGAYRFLKPDIFRAAWRPEIKDCDREHPIWFGPSGQVETDISWHLPENWSAEAEGFPLEGTYDGAALTSDVTVSDGRFQFHMMVLQNGRVSPAEQCDAARAYNRKLRLATESAVFLKKP